MHRFFVDPTQIAEMESDGNTVGEIIISGDDFKHITRVLRIDSKELFEVCDGQGNDYHCKIKKIEDQYLTAQIEAKQPSVGELPYQMTLFQGLPKGKKLDEIIQKGTELGYSKFIPFVSSRSVAEISSKENKKTERRCRIAYEAAKQSKRGKIPEVVFPLKSISETAEQIKNYELVLLAYENEHTQMLKDILQGRDTPPKNIAVIIGPEGGFSIEEVQAFVDAGASVVSLGNRILRTETAGPAAAAMLIYELGE